MSSLKISADIGGTFTDIALFLRDGSLVTRKIPSTPEDYSIGVVSGMVELVKENGVDPGDFREIHHGCTVATNAILEKKGAKSALLTTKGFRDVLELRRIRVPRLYDPLYLKPEPLVPRNHRFEIGERMGPDGRVLVPLCEIDIHEAVARIKADGIEAVAVCYLHSYKNDAHERRTLEILQEELPDCFLSLSVDILPEIKEYERTSTAVVNAYVGPPVSRYISSLGVRLKSAGFTGKLLVMQSSGGALDAESVVRFPARIVECGPAAGVIGSAYEAARCAERNVITFDMGGTTAKASLIEDAKITRTDEYEVGGGISLSSRLLTGGGYALRLPVIDISEVGAGGGSIVRLDKVGAIKVGPESAGAMPGPACYGKGGENATVTDANVVLGYLNQSSLAGGTVSIDASIARSVLEATVAGPMTISAEEAAWSIYVIAAANMVRAVKAVSTYRGRNPSDFTMMAFGGNGGIFAAELMRHLQIEKAIVPRAAGVFSAIGLCVGGVQFSRSKSFLARTEDVDVAALSADLDTLERAVRERIGHAGTRIRTAAMRYVGQAFELPVNVPDGEIDVDCLAAMSRDFEAEHERTYGLRLDGYATEIVMIEVMIASAAADPDASTATESGYVPTFTASAQRRVYFGPQFGHFETPIAGRGILGAGPVAGPLIVEEYEGTTVVPPDATASLDSRGNIIIQLNAQ